MAPGQPTGRVSCGGGRYCRIPFPQVLARFHSFQQKTTPKSNNNPDDWVGDYFIPKGSTVVLNVWAMHHDEKRWDRPADFIPERFASHPKLASHYTSDGPGRDHFGYGAGRRVCPGIHLAERNLFIAMAKLLWAFEFRKKDGDDGGRVESSIGFLQCVREYDCQIMVRSERRAETIRREFEKAGETFASYD